MDKTININLAGSLFTVDEEAFPILRDWLQAITNRLRNAPGGLEIIEDIESRVAEIFRSQNGMAGVITKENVELMITTIGKPEDFESYEENAGGQVYSSTRKRMYRNPDDLIISGVCGGIGTYLNVDPVLFRILFVLFACFGVGAFVYIVLWVALPSANTEARKHEMYGSSYNSAMRHQNREEGTNPDGAPVYNSGYYNSSALGNAFNEMFRAIGRVFYVIVRIFIILFGIIFVLFGFLTSAAFLMVFVFRVPWIFSNDGVNVHLSYFPEFLHYMTSPAAVPWIIALTLVVVILPMLALIYWGVKMIFWFKARDGIVSLTGLVLWVLAITALAMVMFSEGISFAQTGRASVLNILKSTPDTLFIAAGRKCADLKTEKEFSVPDEEYTVYMDDQQQKLFITTGLNIYKSEEKQAKIEIIKRSSGRTRSDAAGKAESIAYSYNLTNDTLIFDEYFDLPFSRRWSADNVKVNLFVPENTVIYLDNTSVNLLRRGYGIDCTTLDGNNWTTHDVNEPWGIGNKFFTMSDSGLIEVRRTLSPSK